MASAAQPAPVAPLVDLNGFESRTYNASRDGRPLELRAVGDAPNGVRFTGYAAKFGKSSQDLGGFIEVIEPGAFSKTIGEADIRLLVNHDPSLVLARRRGDAADTLALAEDGVGLVVTADWPAITYASDLAVSISRGDVSQMSFAFRTVRDDWEVLPDGSYLRHLREVALRDVSIVTYPAYLDTTAALRSSALGELERALGLDTIPADRRAEALALLASGRDPGELLAALRTLTSPAADEAPVTTQPDATPAPSHLATIDRRMREILAMHPDLAGSRRRQTREG